LECSVQTEDRTCIIFFLFFFPLITHICFSLFENELLYDVLFKSIQFYILSDVLRFKNTTIHC
jgi:hypothetical protein